MSNLQAHDISQVVRPRLFAPTALFWSSKLCQIIKNHSNTIWQNPSHIQVFYGIIFQKNMENFEIVQFINIPFKVHKNSKGNNFKIWYIAAIDTITEIWYFTWDATSSNQVKSRSNGNFCKKITQDIHRNDPSSIMVDQYHQIIQPSMRRAFNFTSGRIFVVFKLFAKCPHIHIYDLVKWHKLLWPAVAFRLIRQN